MDRTAAMDERHKPSGEARRRALVSALVLAATALAIYLTFMLKFAR